MKPIVGLALVLALVLSGCSLPGMTSPTPSLPAFPPVATKVAPANTLPPLPTFTRLAITPPVVTATSAPVAQPSATQPPATQPPATQPPAPTQAQPAPTQVQPSATKPAATQAPTTSSSSQNAKLFFVAIGDNGVSGKMIGCGDSLVAVTVALDNPAGPLRSALEQLLAMHNPYYGQSGLYNALFRSDLSVQSVTIQNGVAQINLGGAMTLGGVCDNPRVQQQLEAVALQFSTVQQVHIFINGRSLQDVLSLK